MPPHECPEAALRSLLLSIDGYLRRLPAPPGMPDVLVGLAAALDRSVVLRAAQPNPTCGYLDDVLDLARAQGGGELVGTINAARPLLRWQSYDAYPPAEIGPRFARAHAFASLIGAAGCVAAEDFDLGLFLIAPRTLYRDHRHPAPELYVPLTGPTEWRFGIHAPWRDVQAHEPVWNAPMAIHATRVLRQPFLCLYCWTRDVDRPAAVVPAGDWGTIESGLSLAV